MDYGWSEDDDTDEIKYYTPAPHIRGARYSNEYIDDEQLGEGDKPLFFYVDRVSPASDLPEVYDYEDSMSLNTPQDKPDQNEPGMHEIGRKVDAIAVEDVSSIPDGIAIDFEKIANKTIRDPIEPIVSVMGWDFEEMVTDGSQTGLAKFM